MSDNTLKPCPFCGGEARHYAPGPIDHHIECVKCCADMVGDTEAEAIAAWNTRAERTCEMNRVKMFPENKDCIFECWECSACKRTNDEHRPRFCPNCGRKVVDA